MIFSALTSKIFGGVAIASITFAVVQTVRIEGFWLIKGYEQRLADAEGTIADMRIAAELALSAQEALNNHRRTLDTNNAEILPKICEVYLDVRAAGKLAKQKGDIALYKPKQI